MRARHVIVIIAIAVLAVAAKLLFFPLHNAGAISSQQAGLDVHQMHKDANIQKMPAQDVNDMSLVFDRNN